MKQGSFWQVGLCCITQLRCGLGAEDTVCFVARAVSRQHSANKYRLEHLGPDTAVRYEPQRSGSTRTALCS